MTKIAATMAPMHPKALVDACAALVREVLRLEHPADAVLSRHFKENRKLLGPRERQTLAEVVYAVLRYKPRYEWLARSGAGPQERRLAILGIFIGNPDLDRAFFLAALNAPERAWLEACESAKDSEFQDLHRHNLPNWIWQRLVAQMGEKSAMKWALASLKSAPLDLRVNTFKQKREEAQAALKSAQVKAAATPFSPWGLRVEGRPALQKVEAFERGDLEVQDEGSQLLALLLDAKRSEMVCDFCAGAGGKTLAIGAAMRNTGRIYAFDVSAHRLSALQPRLARSGLSNVHPVAIAHERDERVKRLSGKMHRVLVDAPCSGLGTLRRNPDLKWRQTDAALAELPAKQAAILASAARMVQSGGRLVYATCSALAEENEAIAEAFSAAHADFEPMPVRGVLEGLKFDAQAAASLTGESGAYLKLRPDLHATDGFFAAVWQRK
jgi:16S rRNA (cytosine967-C5)-methyltransferase